MDEQVPENHVARGVGVRVLLAVVDVDAVGGLVPDFEIVDDDVARAHQVHRVGAAFDHRSRFARRCRRSRSALPPCPARPSTKAPPAYVPA